MMDLGVENRTISGKPTTVECPRVQIRIVAIVDPGLRNSVLLFWACCTQCPPVRVQARIPTMSYYVRCVYIANMFTQLVFTTSDPSTAFKHHKKCMICHRKLLALWTPKSFSTTLAYMLLQLPLSLRIINVINMISLSLSPYSLFLSFSLSVPLSWCRQQCEWSSRVIIIVYTGNTIYCYAPFPRGGTTTIQRPHSVQIVSKYRRHILVYMYM